MSTESTPLPSSGRKSLPDAMVLATTLGIGVVCSALGFIVLRQVETLRLQNIQAASARTVQDVLEHDIHRVV